MMYQRDIVRSLNCCGSAQEAEQIFDDGRKEGVGAEEEKSEDQRHDDDHDAGRDCFLAGRPVNLAGLDTDLTDEFSGGNFRHDFRFARFWIEKGSAAQWRRTLPLDLASPRRLFKL